MAVKKTGWLKHDRNDVHSVLCHRHVKFIDYTWQQAPCSMSSSTPMDLDLCQQGSDNIFNGGHRGSYRFVTVDIEVPTGL